MIEGVFLIVSENAILDSANRRKIILDHLSAERAEITRRAAPRRSSRRVLSHHLLASRKLLAPCRGLPYPGTRNLQLPLHTKTVEFPPGTRGVLNWEESTQPGWMKMKPAIQTMNSGDVVFNHTVHSVHTCIAMRCRVAQRNSFSAHVSSPVRIPQEFLKSTALLTPPGFLKCTALLPSDPALLKCTALLPSEPRALKSTAPLPSHPGVYRLSRAKRQTLRRRLRPPLSIFAQGFLGFRR